FEFIGKGGYGIVYSAVWLAEIFREPIALIVSAISRRNDIINSDVLGCYGLSKDPNTNSYLFVTKLCKCDLWRYLEQNFGKIDWFEKLRILMEAANGLKTIHSAGLIHRDFHTGNILVSYDNSIYISDLGLSCYEDKNTTNSVNSGIFGVLPYIAPELLKGYPYTFASDIYSFGIIMWIIAYEELPFVKEAYDDIHLLITIYNGGHPRSDKNVFIPECYKELMEQCWNSIPSNRPNVNELYEVLRGWYFAGINVNQFE
ncbi:8852_t:CDS:2, partial [Racocetra fulgida]